MSTRAEAVTFDSRDPVSDTLGGPSVSTNPPQAGYPRTPRVQSDNSLDMNGAEIEAAARKRRLSESEHDEYPVKQERRGIAAHDRGREDGESSEQEYAVEAVMGYRFEKGKAQLLVKWDGETMRKSTWEPLSSFNDIEAALELWHEGRDKAPDVETLLQARRPRGRPPTAMRFQEEQQQRAADSLGGASRPRSGGGAVFARMSKQSDVAADVSGKPSGMRVNGSASDLRAPGMNGVGPAFSGATPSRGDTPTPATSSGVPVPGTIVGRSRPRKPNRNEVVSGDPTLKHEQRESSLGPTNKMPARQHGRFAQKIIGGRCSACVKTKKGSCGTATAPRSCLRLIEGQRAASILPTLPSLQPSIFGADQQKSDPYRALDDFILRWEAPPQPERKPEDDEEYAEGDGDGDGDEPEPEDQQHEDGGAPGEGRRKPSPPTPSGGSAEEAD